MQSLEKKIQLYSVEGVSKIHVALESFSILLHAANLLKGEKIDGSDKGNEVQTPKEPQDGASEKELGGASASASGKGELGASAQGEKDEATK
ncbi:hypothetical protein ACET3Z_011605 [Daucus carota]